MALAKKDLELLQGVGFSEEQASAILSVSKSEVAKTEEKMVTKESLALKFKDLKIYFIVQGVSIIFASLALLGWFINHSDNRTRLYMESTMDARFKGMESTMDARFKGMESTMEARFQAQDQRFDDFKDSVEARFDKIDSDLNDIKNFIFGTKTINNK